MYNIFNEDCLTGMSRLPDKSVDLILTDPPYNITDSAYECEFDLAGFWKQARRVLKPSSAALIFASAKFAIKAAINTGRNFIGFETEEKYFEIATNRINKAVADNEEIGTISTDTI